MYMKEFFFPQFKSWFFFHYENSISKCSICLPFLAFLHCHEMEVSGTVMEKTHTTLKFTSSYIIYFTELSHEHTSFLYSTSSYYGHFEHAKCNMYYANDEIMAMFITIHTTKCNYITTSREVW
jgi:hypothetical protein